MAHVASKFLKTSSDGTTAVSRNERPKCPDYLPEEAKEIWRKVVPRLAKDGLLWKLDSFQLGNLCFAQYMLERLQIDLHEQGPWHRVETKLVKSPLLRAVQDQQTAVNRLMGEYGLSVKARAALGDTMRSGNREAPKEEPKGVDAPSPRRKLTAVN